MMIKVLSCLALLVVSATPALGQVAEAQRLLNATSLDAGPADGVAGPKTMSAWQTWLAHRGQSPDTPITAETVAELRGDTNPVLPTAKGMSDFQTVGRGFARFDSMEVDPDDPSSFCVNLRAGDFDTVDYSDSGSAMERQAGFALRKQRAEVQTIDSLPLNQTYTMDFKVMLDHALAGAFFQVHRQNSGGGIMLSTHSNSIRLQMGDELNQVAVYRGDYLNRWLEIRVVFYPGSAGDTWVRIYIDGEETLDTSDRQANYPMQMAYPHFGLYRGNVSAASNACFSDIVLSRGDLGAP